MTGAERPTRAASAAGQRRWAIGEGEESIVCRCPQRGGHGHVVVLHGDDARHDRRRRSRHRWRCATSHQTIAAVVRIRRRRCRCVMMVPRHLHRCRGAVRVGMHRARPEVPWQQREQHEPHAAERRDHAREASEAQHQLKSSVNRDGTAAGRWDEQGPRRSAVIPDGVVRKRVTVPARFLCWPSPRRGEGTRDRPDSIATPEARLQPPPRAGRARLSPSSSRGRRR